MTDNAGRSGDDNAEVLSKRPGDPAEHAHAPTHRRGIPDA